MQAGRVAARYARRLPSRPGETRRFLGNVLRYIAAYAPEIAQPRHLPERPLHELFPGIDECEVILTHRFEFMTLPYGEALVLAAITAFLQPRRIFEIGTYTGGATLLMARHAAPDAIVYTLDLPPGDDGPSRVGERFRRTPIADRIVQLHGDSASFDFSPYHDQMDLVFVDAVHTAAYVRSDTEQAIAMCSDGATIVWDDCSGETPDVVTVLNELGTSMPIARIEGTRLAISSRVGRRTP